VRIFLDANILFSAARAEGAMRQLLALAEAGGHELWADAYVMEEARRNLAVKAAEGLTVLAAIAARIQIGDLTADTMYPPQLAVLPEKDRPVLASAITQHCDVLLTGDRSHFGALYGKAIQGVTILSPAMLAETVLSHPH